MWNGYLDKTHPAFDEYKYDFINSALNRGCKIVYLHTSGHASVDEIINVCKITNAKTIIPIHSECPERFTEMGIKNFVKVMSDGETFTI